MTTPDAAGDSGPGEHDAGADMGDSEGAAGGTHGGGGVGTGSVGSQAGANGGGGESSGGGAGGTHATGGGPGQGSGGTAGGGGVVASAGRGGAIAETAGESGHHGGGLGGGGGEAPRPHCDGVARACGASGNADCCATAVVPGGTYDRGNDPRYPATISTFALDTYEVTVGRLRMFIAGYPGNRPLAGSGKNPNNPADPGWDAAWPLPPDRLEFAAALKCGSPEQPATWTATPGANETLPVSCINWYMAYAFCIWDGGRLPTEAEWNYAAAGGAEQRVYPWSSPPDSATIDASYAVYWSSNPFPPTAPVGSTSPKGDGKWGQADLAGNLWEWTQDFVDAYANPCADCATLVAPSTQPNPARSSRGGSITFAKDMLKTSSRGSPWPGVTYGDVGARCARSP